MVRLKSRFFGLLLIVCLLSLLFLVRGPFSVKGNPSTINVYPGPSAIQSAINSANSGDTVLVHNGTYYEHVVINKSISLVGESIAETVIDGNKTGTVVTITANGASIRGFTIGNSSQTLPDKRGSGILISSPGNTLVNNRIINNAIGVYLSSGINNILSSNMISSNQFYGMHLLNSYSNMIANNTISFDQIYGISLDHSDSNVISNNAITFNVYGSAVAVLNSRNNILSGNNITNDNNGVLLLSSMNNTIYHNNFVGNFQHVYIFESGYPNLWDYGKEGNFWSNYTGVDSNADGIGDTPHTIGEDNIDQYPLMGRFSQFNIFLDTTVYAVSVISNSTISDFKFKIGAETGNRIVNFNAADGDGTFGFCRIRIPSQLMQFPYVVLVGSDEVVPRLINASAENAVSYFAYIHSNKTVTIISSQLMRLYALLNSTYNALLNNYALLNDAYSSLSANYTKLQIDFNNLNVSHSSLLSSYALLQANLSSLSASQLALLNNYAILQSGFFALNGSYYTLLRSYGFLTGNYTTLQQGYSGLNQSYTYLLSNYNALVFNYTRLQNNFNDLYNSQQKLLSDLSNQVQNIRNMIYIFIATTTTFLAATIYLSKRAHEGATRKTAVSDEE